MPALQFFPSFFTFDQPLSTLNWRLTITYFPFSQLVLSKKIPVNVLDIHIKQRYFIYMIHTDLYLTF